MNRSLHLSRLIRLQHHGIKSINPSLIQRCQSSSVPVNDDNGTESDKKSVDQSKEKVFRKWTVVPQLRGRSATTNRLWINRFMDPTPADTKIPTSKYLANTPKTMVESYVEEYLPFASNPNVKEEYINIYGNIRVGKIFEDLDALAGSIAYSHCDDGRSQVLPLTIVTASVDKVDLLSSKIPSNQDVRIKGHVTYVGSSSMEISICVEAVPEGVEAAIAASKKLKSEGKWPEIFDPEAPNPNKILYTTFTMVGRDPKAGKAARVNELKLESDLERKMFRVGAERKARRQVAAQTALTRLPPSIEEMVIIHDLHMERMKYLNEGKPENVVYIKDTEQKTLMMCMPQDRNIHGNIFGGFLMRQAYEHAHATAILFHGGPVHFLGSEDIIFKQPVPIGSLLSLTAHVVYVVDDHFYVQVYADIIDPYVRKKVRTNEFFFVFKSDKLKKRVLPESYDESMQLISGRRKELSIE